MRKSILKFIAIIVFICIMSGCVTNNGKLHKESTKPYILRVATTINTNTPSGKALLEIQKQIEDRSEGKVKLDIFWDSTLCGATEIAEGIKIGTVDIGLISSAIISNYTTVIDVFSLPFIIKDREHFKASVNAVDDELFETVKSVLGTPLGIWESGYRHLCTRDREITTLEDCKGLVVRVMDGQVYAETFKALGCIPTNIALSELVPALQQGAIDGVEEPIAIIANQQQYTFCKYVALIGYNYSVMCPVLSNKTIDYLPEDYMKIVQDVFEEYKFYTTDLGQEFEENYIKICEENGMKIVKLPDEQMRRFQDAVSGIWDNYEDMIGKELIEKVCNAGESN